ncbi:RNA polymerase sigma factor [Amaricoccus solimangrovi]|uniref:Sigma-70 family RNA polymerase sigma factor n=1 Tax=Amaricoccus solimangrovi TaxID=2589815 RepID=A0A501WRE1_9RHOB|nr:sigma-70 family RNA polymerase sigma factor [Amaricoccus solimangrovi]TPE49571.1 sigma-70 family RNA polymerase sigma factor [Amaricoccus solimangrovi]
MPHASVRPEPVAVAVRRRLLDCLIAERAVLLADAARILGSRDRAEDVLQDAAIRCLESEALGCPVICPRGMLRRVVRNLALDQARRSGREPAAPMAEEAEFTCDLPCAEKCLADRQALARLADELSRLPPLHREILIEHRLRDARQKHIAARIGLSPARVNAIIARAQDRLRAGLEAPA